MNKPTTEETLAYLRAEKLKQAEPHQGYYDVAISALVNSGDNANCTMAEKHGDTCCGYQKNEYDDEPIEKCQRCEKYDGREMFEDD